LKYFIEIENRLFTVPLEYSEDLKKAIPNLQLQKIQSPFQEVLYSLRQQQLKGYFFITL
jgi:hypothetical protein